MGTVQAEQKPVLQKTRVRGLSLKQGVTLGSGDPRGQRNLKWGFPPNMETGSPVQAYKHSSKECSVEKNINV